MSTISTPAVQSNTLNTGYNSVWASLYDTDMQVPQIWGEIVKLYGPGIGLLEFLYMSGSIVPIAGPTKKVFEEALGEKFFTQQPVGDYMYMGTWDHIHLFKHRDTRQYVKFISGRR